MEIPKKIQEFIAEKSGTQDNIGLSGASVYLFDDLVLKIQPNGITAENEYLMMRWLAGKLPVPKIIEYSKTNKHSFLLMSKCSGIIACDGGLMNRPTYQAELLAGVLHDIWSIDYSKCPADWTLDRKLLEAEQNVISGNVDVAMSEPETFGPKGFKDPETLLYWLQTNRPDEEVVLSHGDFCLPNILFSNGELSGLIDLGRTGKADKWCDIALCYRSLKNNYSGRYSGMPVRNFDDRLLFSAIGIKPDWERIRYYILLDELF